MTYFEALYQFALELKDLNTIDYPMKNLVFLGASAIVGLLTILLDFIGYYLMQRSVLGMHYNKHSRYWLILLAWTFASSAVSYLGIIMNIFNSTIQSCVIVGATWIYLAAKIANQHATPDPEDIQK